MDMEQRVDAFAHVTTIATVTVRLVMMQQLLHFLAVHFLALCILTGATVDKQLEVLFNILLSLASRGFRILILLRVLFHLHLFQRVLVLCIGILLRSAGEGRGKGELVTVVGNINGIVGEHHVLGWT